MSVAARLRAALDRATPLLSAFTEEQASESRGLNKWSSKQIIGHLIDSASNNHQRFVRAQFCDDLVFLPYDQEDWVAAQRYDAESWESLLALWLGFNRHLAHVIETAPDEIRLRVRPVHNLDRIAFRSVPVDQPATLEFFMNDYVDHLEHHLEQIIPEGHRSLLIP
jgi:hypothetical protein